MAWRAVYFNANGGVLHSSSPLYYASTGNYWATTNSDSQQYRISSITIPTKDGYRFSGFYTGSDGTGTRYVDANGNLLATYANPSSNFTIYAKWYNSYKITLSGGSGGTSAFWYRINGGGFYSSAALTTEITSITPPAGAFSGYFHDGTKMINADGTFTDDLLALTPTRAMTFQPSSTTNTEDYFGLASDALVVMASDSGDVIDRIACSHGGRYSSGVNQTSGVWRNPTVTYQVVKSTTVSLTLGEAFSGSGSSLSGYMITSVEINTQIGQFPTVTVTGTANEGADAINAFGVAVPVVARSKAQNLLGAISTSGNLQRMTLRAVCDPVVIVENMMPCASDVVHGRYEVSAEVLNVSGTTAPTAASDFVLTAKPKITRDMDYLRFNVEARKEMV